MDKPVTYPYPGLYEESSSYNNWQLCPKCQVNGEITGMISSLEGGLYTSSIACDLCNGKKVISKLTGQPPA